MENPEDEDVATALKAAIAAHEAGEASPTIRRIDDRIWLDDTPTEYDDWLKRWRMLHEELKKLLRHHNELDKGLLSEWWKAAYFVLKSIGNHPPQDLQLIMAALADEVACGQMPAMIQHVVGPGNRSDVIPARADKFMAAAYCRAAKEGLVNDPDPAVTIAAEYGVTLRTAQKWANEYKDAPEVERLLKVPSGLRFVLPADPKKPDDQPKDGPMAFHAQRYMDQGRAVAKVLKARRPKRAKAKRKRTGRRSVKRI